MPLTVMATIPRFALALIAVLWCTPVSGQSDLDEAARVDSVKKYKFLGKTARDKGDMEAALGYYRELVRYDPGYQRGHFYIGKMLADSGQDGLAKHAFLRSSALDSLHRNTHLGLYQVFMNESNPDSAWWALQRVVRVKKYAETYRPYRRKLADLYRVQGGGERAIFHYSALVGSRETPRPEDRELIELVVDLLREAGQVEEALVWQKRLLALNGGRSEDAVAERVEALASMIDLMVENGDVPAAITNLRKLAGIDERGRYSHYHRMHQLAEENGQRAALMEALQGMVGANPRDLESLSTLIETYLSDEDQKLAAKWIDTGLRSNPGDPHLHLLKGDLLVLQGDEEGALAAFEAARADPGWQMVAQQRIWQIRPPETEEERLKRQFFGGDNDAADE